jgi:glycine/D-amino acid oxidase-like deaminating enzyme
VNNESYYQATAPWKCGLPLSGEHECDIAIVGGGFAGLAVALGLVERGQHDVTLLEAEQVGHGASGRNGGFIFGGFSLGEDELLAQHGPERAQEIYQLTLQGGELIQRRVGHYGIDCDYQAAGVILADWFGDDERLREKQSQMRSAFDVDWQWLAQDELRSMLNTQRYFSGLLEAKAAHFHPLKYCQGLAQALRRHQVPVYEKSAVQDIQQHQGGYILRTAQGSVRARKVVIAGGGYIHGLNTPVAKAVLPIATYVAATEPLGDRLQEFIRGQWAVYDTRFAFDYYRPLPDTRLLWGGRISIRRPGRQTLERWLRRDLAKVFPELAQEVRFEQAWYGLMGYMRHKMPCVQETQPGLWHVIGFGGHGVAPTSGLGDLMAAVLTDGDERHRWFSRYQMPPVYGFAGSLAAQATYWQAQLSDWWKDRQFRNRRTA